MMMINIYLLISGECSKSKVLLHAVGSQDEGGREVLGLGQVAGNVGAFNNALLPGHSLDEGVGEPGRGVGHGQGGTAGTSLSLHNLGSSILEYNRY